MSSVSKSTHRFKVGQVIMTKEPFFMPLKVITALVKGGGYRYRHEANEDLWEMTLSRREAAKHWDWEGWALRRLKRDRRVK